MGSCLCGELREERIGAFRFRALAPPRCASSLPVPGRFGKATGPMHRMSAFPFPTHWNTNTRRPRFNGIGSGCSRHRITARIRAPGKGSGSTSSWTTFSEASNAPRQRSASAGSSLRTSFGMPMRPIQRSRWMRSGSFLVILRWRPRRPTFIRSSIRPAIPLTIFWRARARGLDPRAAILTGTSSSGGPRPSPWTPAPPPRAPGG